MREQVIVVYGTKWCRDCRLAKQVLDDRHVDYRWIDVDDDPTAQAEVLRLNGGMRSVPTIIFPDGAVLVEPTAHQIITQIDKLLLI